MSTPYPNEDWEEYVAYMDKKQLSDIDELIDSAKAVLKSYDNDDGHGLTHDLKRLANAVKKFSDTP